MDGISDVEKQEAIFSGSNKDDRIARARAQAAAADAAAQKRLAEERKYGRLPSNQPENMFE